MADTTPGQDVAMKSCSIRRPDIRRPRGVELSPSTHLFGLIDTQWITRGRNYLGITGTLSSCPGPSSFTPFGVLFTIGGANRFPRPNQLDIGYFVPKQSASSWDFPSHPWLGLFPLLARTQSAGTTPHFFGFQGH